MAIGNIADPLLKVSSRRADCQVRTHLPGPLQAVGRQVYGNHLSSPIQSGQLDCQQPEQTGADNGNGLAKLKLSAAQSVWGYASFWCESGP